MINNPASGLTCSMCSKAIYKSLSKLPAVEKVDVDIDKSSYILSFKPQATIDIASFKRAVSMSYSKNPDHEK